MDANQYISMLLREYRNATMNEVVPGCVSEESPDYRYYLGMAVGLGFVNQDGSPADRLHDHLPWVQDGCTPKGM